MTPLGLFFSFCSQHFLACPRRDGGVCGARSPSSAAHLGHESPVTGSLHYNSSLTFRTEEVILSPKSRAAHSFPSATLFPPLLGFLILLPFASPSFSQDW